MVYSAPKFTKKRNRFKSPSLVRKFLTFERKAGSNRSSRCVFLTRHVAIASEFGEAFDGIDADRRGFVTGTGAVQRSGEIEPSFMRRQSTPCHRRPASALKILSMSGPSRGRGPLWPLCAPTAQGEAFHPPTPAPLLIPKLLVPTDSSCLAVRSAHQNEDDRPQEAARGITSIVGAIQRGTGGILERIHPARAGFGSYSRSFHADGQPPAGGHIWISPQDRGVGRALTRGRRVSLSPDPSWANSPVARVVTQ